MILSAVCLPPGTGHPFRSMLARIVRVCNSYDLLSDGLSWTFRIFALLAPAASARPRKCPLKR
jgi:hypothetical protein